MKLWKCDADHNPNTGHVRMKKVSTSNKHKLIVYCVKCFVISPQILAFDSLPEDVKHASPTLIWNQNRLIRICVCLLLPVCLSVCLLVSPSFSLRLLICVDCEWLLVWSACLTWPESDWFNGLTLGRWVGRSNLLLLHQFYQLRNI